MSIQYAVKRNGIKISLKGATIQAIITGTGDYSAAYTTAVAYSAAAFAGFWRSECRIDDRGAGIWDVEIEYGDEEHKQPEEGEVKWSFDTTGGTKHITVGLSTIEQYVPDGYGKTDHKGAINVEDDGRVAGVDVIDYQFKWTETRQLLLATFSWTYASILNQMTGKVNNGVFRGMQAGTVLFKGAGLAI